MTDRLFLEHSVPELMRRQSAGELSPVEMADEAIAQVERAESDVHAWVAFDPERLHARAEAIERATSVSPETPLRGIPFAVKDIFNTSDFPTQMGSASWKDFTPGNNARVVDTLGWAGALSAGKTVTAEFAVHALNETLNPHGAQRTPGSPRPLEKGHRPLVQGEWTVLTA